MPRSAIEFVCCCAATGAGRFEEIVFASLGTPTGLCLTYSHGDCMADPAVVRAAGTSTLELELYPNDGLTRFDTL